VRKRENDRKNQLNHKKPPVLKCVLESGNAYSERDLAGKRQIIKVHLSDEK